MSEMIERAAAALATKGFERDVRLSEMTGDELDEIVRTIISEMQEPIEAVVNAGIQRVPFGHKPRPIVINAWKDMISEILTPTETETRA